MVTVHKVAVALATVHRVNMATVHRAAVALVTVLHAVTLAAAVAAAATVVLATLRIVHRASPWKTMKAR
jgi:hypothetical protein